MTTTFLVIGAIGIFLLIASLFSGAHVGHLHLPIHLHTHTHTGHSDTAISLPSIAGFIGAFGFGGAIAAQLSHTRSAVLPLLIGLVAAVPTAWLAARLTRAAMEMHTDATPTRADVIGSLGVVIREIPAEGYGEVRVGFAGTLMKFHAKATTALPAGARILVIEAPSSTSVIVEAIAPPLS